MELIGPTQFGMPQSRVDQQRRWQRCWQRCHGSLNINPSYGRQDAGRNDATLATGLGRTGNKIVAAPNTAVMFVEVTYDYQPLISNRLFGPSRIRYESAFNVRERTNQNITNTQSLTVKTCP